MAELITDLYRYDELYDPTIENFEYIPSSKDNSTLGTTPLNVPNPVKIEGRVSPGTFVLLDKSYVNIKFKLATVSGGTVLGNLYCLGPHGWVLARRVTLRINGVEVDTCDMPGLQAHILSLLSRSRSEIMSVGELEQYFPLESTQGIQASESAATADHDEFEAVMPVTTDAAAYAGSLPVGDSSRDIPTLNRQFHRGALSLLSPTITSGYVTKYVKLPLSLVFGFCNQKKMLPCQSVAIYIEPNTSPLTMISSGLGGTPVVTQGVLWEDATLYLCQVRPGQRIFEQVMNKMKSGDPIPLNYTKFGYIQFTDLAASTSIKKTITISSRKLKYLVIFPQNDLMVADTTRSKHISGVRTDWTSASILVNNKQYPSISHGGSANGYITEMEDLYRVSAKFGLASEDSWITRQRYTFVNGPAAAAVCRMYPLLVFDLSHKSEELQLQNSDSSITLNLTWAGAPASAGNVTYHCFWFSDEMKNWDPITGQISNTQ